MSFIDDARSSFNNAVDSAKATLSNNGVIPAETSINANEDTKNSAMAAVSRIKGLQNSVKYTSSIMQRGIKLEEVNQEEWNKVFPYRLLLLKVDSAGKYQLSMQYDLPITPKSLEISTPFAIVPTITSRGVLEEHNGAPIRQINFTGTTGIMIKRPSYGVTNPDTSTIGTIFAGTISAANQVRSAVALATSQTGIRTRPKQSVTGKPDSDRAEFYSGYFQLHLLDAFLNTYADLKKQPNGRSYRLALQIAKDKTTYLVAPQDFIKRRSESSPLEYLYTFTGLAWGTVPANQISQIIGSGPKAGSAILSNADLSTVQKTLNFIRNSRNIIQKFKDVITAVKTDIDVNVIGPLNNIILVMKEVASIPKTLADLPSQISQSFQTAVVREADNIWPTLPPSTRSKFQAAASLSADSVSSSSSYTAEVSTKASVLDDIEMTDNINVDSLPATPAQQTAINQVTSDAFKTDNSDVQKLITQLELTVTALESSDMMNDQDSPVWPIMYALGDSIQAMYSFLADNTFGTNNIAQQQAGADSLIDTYRNLTSASGIGFNAPKGKFSIPFPFKSTLEQLAGLYLGDPTRWIEIAAINNLQSPYVDEDGLTYSFISNGSGRQINIKSNQNLYSGQSIYITSNTQNTTKRKISTIQKVNDTNYIVTVDGEDNMGLFTLADKAEMRAYLPNTINSLQLVYIPSDQEAAMDNTESKSLPFIDEDPQLLKMSKIDWLLDNNGDLAVTNDGFFNLAFGKTNLVQAAKLKMSATAGKIILHPNYGAGVDVGDSDADISVDDIRARVINNFASDERFSQISSLEINRSAGVIEMNLTVRVAETDSLLPLSFKIQ